MTDGLGGINGLGRAQDLTGAVVGRFVVRSRLGAGGMGEVYKADDPLLKRVVALKRLSSHVVSDPRYRARFLKEGQRASSLNHPHIASVFDVLEEGTELFLVMEYVEGSNLRERLNRAVSIPEFLAIGTQCLEALGAAHGKGIVHSDIKPENIMLTPDGEVKILDFGVARRIATGDDTSEPDAPTRSVATDANFRGGTLAYMAPEVLLRNPSDGRVDIFALGVVFYEMLVGRHPFRAQQGTVDRILHEDPEALHKINPLVPKPLGQVIARMLAKDPGKRYPTAENVSADLRAFQGSVQPPRTFLSRTALFTRGWLGAVLALALLAATLTVVPATRRRLQSLFFTSIPQQKQLAILPFAVVGSDPQTKALADGITDTLTAKLTQLTSGQQLQVIPSTLVQSMGVKNIVQARRELGVNLVIIGSLQNSGQMVRIAPVLIDARTNRQLRADVMTAPLANPFEIEDRVVKEVMAMLEINIRPEQEASLESHGTKQPGAYDLYLQARGYLLDYYKPENLESAISLFRQALKLDPKYTLAYAGLGEAYLHKYNREMVAQYVTQARQNCAQAALLNDRQAESHVCLGQVDLVTGKYDEAAGQFRRAIHLEPAADDAYVGLATAYENLGRLAGAERTYQQAISLKPNYWVCYNSLGIFYIGHARYAEAAKEFSKVVSLLPKSSAAYDNLGVSLLLEGKYPDAIEACQRSLSIRPSSSAYSNTATAYFYERRFTKAADIYRKALKLNEGDYLYWGNLGDADSWIAAKGPEAKKSYLKAIALAETRLNVNPKDGTALSYVAWYHAALKEKAAALAAARRALQATPNDTEVLFNVALVFNQLGETDQALEFVGKAARGGYSAALIRDTPYFDNLRAKQRFQRVLSGE